jgi:mannosidase alpha-like ER degradation enhancer 2
MTGESRFLTLADDLATRLLPAFNSPTGMPYRFVNLKTGKTSGAESNPAEIGTLILEFGALAKLTHKSVYFEKTKRAMTELFARRAPATGLLGEGINVDTGAWVNTSSHVGGGIDSFYEYALKCERLFDDRECGAMARASLASVNKYLADDGPGGLWYGVSEMDYGRRTATTYGALHAFLPAVFALEGDLPRARRLQDSNYTMWTRFGIEPEELDYRTMTIVRAGYQLRPENIESAYYLFHYTKDPIYLEMGRQFLNDLIKYCRTDNGYTVLRSVVTKEKGDRMHSFLLAETFKYLYLLFAPEGTIDFDRVTFNTEAHPLLRTW